MLAILLSILLSLLSYMNQNDNVVAHSQGPSKPDNKPIVSKFSCTDIADARELPPPGPGCEKELLARRGRPYMFPARSGIAFGVSSGPDKPSTVYLWVENQTDKTIDMLRCCGKTLNDHVEIFGSDAHRVLSKADQEQQKAGSEERKVVQICTCSGWSEVPAHAIQLLDSSDISV